MTHPADFRYLCAEHLKAWDSDKKYADNHDALVALIEQTRALLAAPQQGAPSDRIRQIAADVEKCALSWDSNARLLGNVTAEDIVDLCNAVLTRYSAQAVPVAVAERPWEREGWCDAGGNCWLYDGFAWRRLVVPNGWTKFRPFTHSLPHWALPLPETTHD